MLRDRGHDVVSAHELGAAEISDDDQLTRATVAGRALVTFNYTDFVSLAHGWADQDRPHAGIVISYRQYGRSQLCVAADALSRLIDALDAEALSNTTRPLDDYRER